MRNSRRMLLSVFTMLVLAFVGLCVPLCLGQNAPESGQAAPNVTGGGSAGRITAWKNSTTLGNSVLVESSAGNVGIGTATPAAKLEVNGNAQVDGNFSLSGSILLNGAGQLLWAAGSLGNLSAGLGALPATTTGSQNTAVGDDALRVNTTGSGNSAIGSVALGSNTTGSENTAEGLATLPQNSTGSDNTAIGSLAMNSNTTGGGNTASGKWALASNTAGNYNIALGFTAGINVTTTSNNIHIGHLGTATDSGTIRIGTVGTQTSAFVAGIYGSMTGLTGVPVVVDANGQLGTISSARRYKEDIHDMGTASEGLMRLRPVIFRYKKPFDDGSKPVQYGLIAEEVAEVYPDLVARSADGQVETVRYQVLDSILLNELQKQNATITAQKEQIRSLEERLARVEAALERTSLTASSR